MTFLKHHFQGWRFAQTSARESTRAKRGHLKAVEIIQSQQPVYRGSLIRYSRRCGSPKCKCAKGQLHQGWALSVSVEGKTQVVYIPEELLLVLDRPDIPLHNNLSERDIREYVKKRKISGSTRSDNGRRCRDTFTSLKKTCRKLGVSFWGYLNDRVSNAGEIPPLPDLIRARARSS